MDSKPNNTPKARSLKEILAEFKPIDQVIYEPIELEPHRDVQALLPPTFSTKSHPFDYFTLFFTPQLFSTITKHTNQYVAIQRRENVQERQREWDPLIPEELYVFLGVIIYIGIHLEPSISMYWNIDFNKGPLHPVSNHITLRRFEQIKRYYYISCSESDKRAGNDLPSNKRW
jgi:hypothetical protein